MAECADEGMSPVRPRRQELRGTPRLRSDELPPDTLILLRGAPNEVDEMIESAADSGERYALDGQPFYGLSVIAVLTDDSEDDLLAAAPMRRHPQYHRMTAGALRAAGFPVWATFRNPRHYDVQLAAASAAEVRRCLAVFGPIRDNPQYVPEE